MNKSSSLHVGRDALTAIFFLGLFRAFGPGQTIQTVTSVVASGGGSTIIGAYTLTSTIGQAFADISTIGSNTNATGFWNIFSQPTGSPASGTFSVTTTEDSVTGSLRAAIDSANAAQGSSVIVFNIPGGGLHTLTLHAPLPTCTRPVTIDGYTQSGAAPNTNPVSTGSNAKLMVQLDGSQAGNAASGLHLTGGNSTVRGLIINGFAAGIGPGMILDGIGGDVIEGNMIGTDSSGTVALGNFDGIEIRNSGNTIGGATTASRNVISSNLRAEIYISGDTANSNVVYGNYIGVTASGDGDLSKGSGVWIESPGNIIGASDSSRRNIISGNSNPAVYLPAGHAGGTTIEGNYIGMNAAGTVAVGAAGVSIYSPNNIVRRNVVSGARGLVIQGTSGNTVQGNVVGLTADGTAAAGKNNAGVGLVYSTHTVVGGVTPETRNVISVVGHGVYIAGGDSNTVQGNYIGTNGAGTTAVIPGGAAGSGIDIEGSFGNLIGGMTGGARNVVANAYTGISITSGSSGNIVSGNFVGTNASGTASLGNLVRGVALVTPQGSPGTRNNLIGGVGQTAGNLISGNAGPGIYVAGANQNVIQGNIIGLAADGTSPLPNASDGISIGADSNLIGPNNRIAFSGVGFKDSRADGIRIFSGIGNAITGNSLYSNNQLGIDLYGSTGTYAGVTANDSCDVDDGPNKLQNFPVLSSATVAGNRLLVKGSLNSAQNTAFRVEFFSSPVSDSSGFGEGQTFLGFATVATGSSCEVSFVDTLPVVIPAGYDVSATATDAGGNTSEFSKSIRVDTTSATGAWATSIRIADACNSAHNLTFGQDAAGSNGIDPALGEAEIPPVPPTGVFDSRFILPLTPSIASWVDFRSDSLKAITWHMSFQGCAYPMKFTWDSAGLPAGNLHLRDEVNGSIVYVDMKRQSGYTLTNAGITSLRIDYSQDVCNTVTVFSGWNMVSIPLAATDTSVSACFPRATSQAFRYNNGYVPEALLSPGKGYWLKFAVSDTFSICGKPVVPKDISVTAGWNLIGPFEFDVPVSSIGSTPAAITSSQFYGYTNGYVTTSTLLSGKGYWVKASQAGILHFPNTVLKTSVASTDSVDSWAKIVVEGSDGQINEVYLAPAQEMNANFDLPPMPPAGILDVRYSSNTNVEKLGQGRHELLLSSASYPVTIRLEGLNREAIKVTDAVDGKLFSGTLREGKSVTIAQRLDKLILEEAETAGAIPKDFALSQNYPNPFNPSTVIKYAIPQKSLVTLMVYNTLGQQVSVLVNQEQEPGYYDVKFDNPGLASGVYLYRMKANNFVDVKKLILLK